jgi:hypothetical protein
VANQDGRALGCAVHRQDYCQVETPFRRLSARRVMPFRPNGYPAPFHAESHRAFDRGWVWPLHRQKPLTSPPTRWPNDPAAVERLALSANIRSRNGFDRVLVLSNWRWLRIAVHGVSALESATSARSLAFLHSPFSGPGCRNRWKMRAASSNTATVSLPRRASRSRSRNRAPAPDRRCRGGAEPEPTAPVRRLHRASHQHRQSGAATNSPCRSPWPLPTGGRQ